MENKNECRAFVVYRPPSYFTAIEDAIFFNGTHQERIAILKQVLTRSMGIPAGQLGTDSNYSSARIDSDNWDKNGTKGT